MGDNLHKDDRRSCCVVRMAGHAAQGEEAAIACAGAMLYRKYFMPPVNLLARLFSKVRMSDDSAFSHISHNSLRDIKDGEYMGRNKKFALNDNDKNNIAVGLHQNIVVTSGYGSERTLTGKQKQMQVVLNGDGITVNTDATQIVSQIFTAVFNASEELKKGALDNKVKDLSRLLLRGSYEGTLKAACYTGNSKVVLTFMGGGLFFNDIDWIFDALNQTSLKQFINAKGLQVAILYRPKVRKGPGGKLIRTAETDTRFLCDLLALTDDINGTKLAQDQDRQQDIAVYIKACYEKSHNLISQYAKKLQQPFSQLTKGTRKSDSGRLVDDLNSLANALKI